MCISDWQCKCLQNRTYPLGHVRYEAPKSGTELAALTSNPAAGLHLAKACNKLRFMKVYAASD